MRVPLTSTPRVLRAVVMAAAVIIATTACVDIDESITFNADGSGTYEATTMVDTAVFEVIAQSDPSMAAAFSSGFEVTDANRAEARSMFGPSASLETATEVYDGHVYRGSTLRVPFASTAQFNDTTSKSVQHTGGPSANPASAWRLTVEGTLHTLTGRMDAITGPDGTIDAALFENAERNLSVTITGAVVDHNADDSDGRTFYWTLYATDPVRDVKISWRPRG